MNITLGPVNNPQNICPLPVAHCHPDIRQNIPHDPVVIKIWYHFLHHKRNIILLQLGTNGPRLRIGTKKHRHLPVWDLLIAVRKNLLPDLLILLGHPLEFLHTHSRTHHKIFFRPYDLFRQTILIVSDHTTRQSNDLAFAPIIYI